MGTVAAAGRRPRGGHTFYHHYILREDEHPPKGLLGMQAPYGQGANAHPDELLFVAIHQTYEIWFKVMIDELMRAKTGVIARVKAGRYQHATRALRRLSRITRVLRDQYEIVETISPTDFLVFRDVLRPSSGYDSCQFRALEIAAGLRRDEAYMRHLVGEEAAKGADPRDLARMVEGVAKAVESGRRPRLEAYSLLKKIAGTGDANGLRLMARALAGDSLQDAAYDALEATSRAPAKGGRASRIERATADLYRRATQGKLDDPGQRALFDLVEALIEFDEAFRNLRTVHIHMVMRVIGSRPGTGGSSGAAYLRTTLDFEFFPLLWSARNAMEG